MSEAEQRRSKLVELILQDYTATQSLINSVVQTASAIRSLGMTLTLALLGYSTAAASVIVAVVGLLSSLVFLFVDAYHGWLYSVARRRVRATEEILRLRYRALERGDDEPDADQDLDAALGAYKLGQYLSLPRFHYRDLRSARPIKLYVSVYGSLVLLSCGAIIYGVCK